MSTSFQEAVEAVAKRRKISEDEAALIVAEEYGQVADYEDTIEDRWGHTSSLLDEPDEADVWLRQHEAPSGRAIPIDEDRSAAGTIFAQAERMAAKADGDYYREMSKRTSMG